MAVHQFWRLTGFLTDSNVLELSQAQLYDGTTLIAQAPTFTVSPTTGTTFPSTLRWENLASGLALVWNLTTPVDSPNLRLGAGSSATTFPKEFYFQYSDDGLFWSTNNLPLNVLFPGMGLLTDAPGTGGGGGGGTSTDPFASSVVLLATFDGLNGSASLTDFSPQARVMTPNSGAVISAAQSKYGGSSTLLAGGAYWSSPASADFAFPADFTIEFWALKTANAPDNYDQVCATDSTNGSASGGWFMELATARGFVLGFNGNVAGASNSAIGNLNDGLWHHWAVSRVASDMRFFKDGSLIATATSSFSLPANSQFGIGRNVLSGYYFNGYLDDLRITKGVGRYTANFTPAPLISATAVSVFIPLSTEAPAKRWRALPPPDGTILGSAIPDFNFRQDASKESFLDAYFGGNGVITGTVKEKSTPANVPLRRKVLLIDEATQLVIRQTWSDVLTGNYEFNGIRSGVGYSVVSYDHLRNYRAVVADNIMPELMS